MSITTPDPSRLAEFIPFDGLSQTHLQAIQGQLEVLNLPPGRMVFKRGQHSDKAYFLVDGELDLIDAGFSVRPFSAGDDENYLALDNCAPHTVNAITRTGAILYTLDRDKLDLLMAWTGAVDLLPPPGQEEQWDWTDALLASGLFARIAPAKLHTLFMQFRPREVEMGTTVVREGDAGDTFYVLKQGQAMVTRGQGRGTGTLATLGPGRFFGEDALISDQPRNATVTMTSDGVLMCLGQDDFQDILQASVIRHLNEDTLNDMVLDGDHACILLDVRLPMEFRHDRTPGARNIPLGELRQKAPALERDFTYILCSAGRRSELGAYILSEAGLNAYVLDRETKKDDATKDVLATE
ncbi:cAMP-dependent protein kinase regulatory chain [Alcanivorax xiamenensis]|uniref:cAMP-dependent protein kinase regulatory chain n=1 Tax=Alcanivorax xiamenensis TaxID=1177156 RepID=A0ABQ6YBK3_9GAMM|nr:MULTISPECIES: cyclic nucleotide-binding domain-containing protein [Alcanivorax]KAF0807354.1 cAMP-dependent protein kinase regulatory chain [Alcanivorax xiamenensis]